MSTLTEFDLSAPIADDGDMGDDFAPVVQQAPPSPHALKLDRWSIRQGEALIEDELFQLSGCVDPIVAADMRAAAFEPDPELSENCDDPLRQRFVEELLNTPDWNGLRASTVYDDLASEMAAAHAARQYLAMVAQAERDPEGFDPDISGPINAAIATHEAKEEHSDMKAACRALGGDGSSDGTQRADRRALAETFKRVRHSQRLRAICNAAGRFRRLAQAQQRRKTIHGQDDVVGIEQGGDLGRLIASELAQLADDDTELLALRRIVERQAMCREYQGIEPVGKGPIVVVVDESGSMGGDPVVNAKALALALAWVAKQQKRWVGLVGYSGGSGGTRLAMPPGEWNEPALLDWLEHFFGCGSSCDVPVRELPNEYWPEFAEQGLVRGATDCIIITDAICEFGAKAKARFEQWKRDENVTVFSIVIGSESAGDLADVSDRLYFDRELDIENPSVAEVLSI